MKTANVQQSTRLQDILFLTDYSSASDAAAPFAKSLAQKYGAKVTALHVRSSAVDPMSPPASWYGLDDVTAAREKELKKGLAELFVGVEAEPLIEEGTLLSSVQEIVQARNIDLIVMGTHGRTGVGRLLMGSAAEEVFREAPCPVLTVGPHSDVNGEKGKFGRVLFATDFSEESKRAAPYALALAQEHQAHITLMHVISEPEVGDLVQPHELLASSEKLLRSLVPPGGELWCTPDYVVERGERAEKILDVARRRHADLIVLGVKKTTGFPGAGTHLPIAIAHDVVIGAPCPVLTVRS